MTSSLPPSSPSRLPLGGSSSRPKRITWAEFISRRKERYEEAVKRETPQQQQVRLSRLRNPPKVSAKVFEWVEDENGDLYRQATSKKMREDNLGNYPARQIHYDPIENEYDCCREYDSGAFGEPFDDDIDDYLCWDDDDVGIIQVDDDKIVSARVPSPDVEIDDSWNLPSMTEAPHPLSSDNFIAEVHRILYLYFGYTPVVPTLTFDDPILKTEADRQRFIRFLGISCRDLPVSAYETAQISAAATFVHHLHTKGSSISTDEWDLRRENRQSIFFSARLKAIRCVGENLFMFDFKNHSTVKWDSYNASTCTPDMSIGLATR